MFSNKWECLINIIRHFSSKMGAIRLEVLLIKLSRISSLPNKTVNHTKSWMKSTICLKKEKLNRFTLTIVGFKITRSLLEIGRIINFKWRSQATTLTQ
jgi:hypothetical protein